MMSNSEKMKAKKWGDSLRMMGRCFNPTDPNQEPFPQELQGNEQHKHGRQNQHAHHHHHQHQQQQYYHHRHQNYQHHHPSTRKSPGLPKRASMPSKEESGEKHHKLKSHASTGSHQMHIARDIRELRQGYPAHENVDVFKFDELKSATKHFRPDLILGEGGFGVVYKGILDESIRPKYKPSIQVAIKQLNRNGFQGDREWLTEVNYLGQLSYPNLVKLIGYCCEGDQRLLVYEYMASGSLERHLFRRSSTTMTWLRRIKVALDAAKGLAYLHGLEKPIIYRDVKTSNVLLDENFNGKLSDFGLVKEGPSGDQTHVSTRVMGTYGYAAPEYIMTGHLTAMSDVYSFGAVLLELLIGRRVLEKTRSNREHNLVEICHPILNNTKKLPRILDSRIEGQYSSESMTRVANLAYQCLSNSPKGRPAMRQVVQILETVYEQESGQIDSLFDKKSDETQKVGEDGVEGEEERQPLAHRLRRSERSRSEPQNGCHTFDQTAVDVMSPSVSDMRNI